VRFDSEPQSASLLGLFRGFTRDLIGALLETTRTTEARRGTLGLELGYCKSKTRLG
jgi:hypothetical protein